jgi:tripartite ATP-independent transporter DctM subunit
MLMLFLLVFTILIGFPTAFTLMALGVIFGVIGFGSVDIARDLLVQRTYTLMRNDVLVAIPLFLFMGYMIERSGVLDRLFYSLQVVVGPMNGALALATLFTGTIFATATGIVGASVALLGVLALPAMLRARYQPAFASGVVTASGTLGILIPPSVLLILYGFVAGVSVPRLYAGAFLPGLMLSGLYLVYIIGRAYLQPNVAPALAKELRQHVTVPHALWLLLTGFLPIAVLIGAVLASILVGLATPSEAAALGGVAAIGLAAAYRRLTWQNLKESVFLTARTSAMVGWLLVGSGMFASVFARLGGAQLIGDFVVRLGLNEVGFFWLAQAIIFFLGWPLEWTEITIIFLPLFLPLLEPFNIDPLFFGIMTALNQQTSFLSPPVAMSAYYLKGVAPTLLLNQIFRGMYPFLAIQVLAMGVLWLFPALATWLPDVVYGVIGER